MIPIMENRRCLYCGRKIHPALRLDAKYCGRSCKSSYNRDKKMQPVVSQALVQVQFSPIMTAVANAVQAAAPKGAEGYILRRQGCPLGAGIFDFPVPLRKTKHADGSLTRSAVYQLWPFEPPRVPWPGPYELLFWVPDQGLLRSADPQHQQIDLSRNATVPRAAFDKHALVLWIPAADDPDSGSADYLQREVLSRAPAGAIGYMLGTSGAPQEPGPFVFPPKHEFSRRANRGLSDIPFYSLSPFELPCVPWAGTYRLSYEMEHGIVHFNPDPALHLIRVGLIFPYADYSKPKPVEPPALALLPPGRPTLLLNEVPGPRRAFRQRRGGKK